MKVPDTNSLSETRTDQLFPNLDLGACHCKRNSFCRRLRPNPRAASGDAQEIRPARVLVPDDGTAEDTELLDLIRDAGPRPRPRLHTDVLSAPTAAQLARQTPGGLVVIATNLADKVGLSPEDLTDPKRCVVVVQGSDSAPARLAPAQ